MAVILTPIVWLVVAAVAHAARSRRPSMPYLSTYPRSVIPARPMEQVPVMQIIQGGQKEFPAFFSSNFIDAGDGDINQAPIEYGGVLRQRTPLAHDSEEGQAVIAAVFKKLQLSTTHIRRNTMILRRVPLRVTNNHGTSGLTIQAAHSMDGRCLQRFHYNVTMGINYWIEFILNDSEGRGETHRVGVSLEPQRHRYHVMQHTYWSRELIKSLNPSQGLKTIEVDATGEMDASTDPPPSLRIMSYNVWNTNPPHWVYPDRRDRFQRYNTRMDLLAKYIKDASPDIIGFQEVRFDGGVVAEGGPYQMKHLIDRLPEYTHYVWQPAHLYFDPQNLHSRVEEGAAIFSKFPILSTDYLLLPRFLNDEDDRQHQRACLHARIVTPKHGEVDVFTVHLSLSKTARDKSVRALWEYIRTNATTNTAILLGDLNDEPQGEAMKYLAERMEDTWLWFHDEPEPRSKDPSVRQNAFTFPSDDPKKRIDFIFAHQLSKDAAEKIEVLGQDASEETRGEPGHGMLDGNSPMWASDHRAVMLTLV